VNELAALAMPMQNIQAHSLRIPLTVEKSPFSQNELLLHYSQLWANDGKPETDNLGRREQFFF
jgi:hypothetical protein